jgi:predicted RNA-binding Zn ribbon-like protein
MVLTHDTAAALRAAVELVNSGESPETLTSVADVEAFYAKHGYTGRHDRTRAELEQLRELRPALRELLLAPRDAAAEQVNAILAQTRAVPQLRRHDEQDWHLHLVVGEAPLAERIAAETAMAMVDVIRTNEHSRIAVCADDGCRGLALDLSRNRSRRYCSTTCANRNAVAAYRARRSG